VVKMIKDGYYQFLGGTRFLGGRRAKRTQARALRAELSERSRLRKIATKPAEFSGPNRSTQLYSIISVLRFAPPPGLATSAYLGSLARGRGSFSGSSLKVDDF
jgi:hypothetical protein